VKENIIGGIFDIALGLADYIGYIGLTPQGLHSVVLFLFTLTEGKIKILYL
jgi:hypothetical protein